MENGGKNVLIREPAKQGQNQNNEMAEKMEFVDRRKLFFKHTQK